MSGYDLLLGVRVGEYVTREVAFGTQTIWCRFTRERDGWRADWEQSGAKHSVAVRGGIQAATTEARLRMRTLDIPPADDTEPELPDAGDAS
ncbi:MAG TPA: hypothetical protein VMI75_38610 [Polyangiaceae bacterium]|nr:hypothetical protein [Polyangiaceae bacterium]